MEGVVDEAAEFEDEGASEGVEDALSFASAGEDAGMDEEAEVFGDVGLGGFGVGDDFVDAFGAKAEGLKDSEAGGIAEGFEESGDEEELIVGEGGLGLTHC